MAVCRSVCSMCMSVLATALALRCAALALAQLSCSCPCVGVGPGTYALVLLAGLATSLSPCTLSVLPLTIGYIGGSKSAPASSSTLQVGGLGEWVG